MTTAEPVVLIGAGGMAVEYSKVLSALGRAHLVLGRGEASARAFAAATGVTPTTGPLREQLEGLDTLHATAIVAVNAMYLADVTAQLARAGVSRMLVEKPAALDTAELAELVGVADAMSAEIRIGYNRRFMASVLAAREMIDDDGGVLSVKFDFSEPSRRIATLDKPQRELDTWMYGNSSHVIDLALHLVGDIRDVHGDVAGGVSWHRAGGVFVGHGRAASGALVSWHANWVGPGRWGLEVITPERRLILQPLERLRVQDHSSFDERPVDLDLALDTEFKPGLMRQVRAFLTGDGDEHLADLAEHASMWPVYEAIRTGTTYPSSEPPL